MQAPVRKDRYVLATQVGLLIYPQNEFHYCWNRVHLALEGKRQAAQPLEASGRPPGGEFALRRCEAQPS
jgi:hypothetical protein